VVNLPQAAMALGVSVDTVRRLVSKGDLPHVRIGNRIRLRRTDVHDYVNNRTTCNWRPGAGE
jgi:excisionase family DNA binding protein